MSENYFIDLGNYSLQKFRLSLQKREMIPSRVVLKESIEERFAILHAQGIDNLKTLIEVLKSKPKIELFSRKTGLSIDYLSILKREAGSYLPNPIRLREFSEIDAMDIEVLEKHGIKNTRQFFDKGKTDEQRTQLSRLTGISIEKLNELTSLSDLSRLYGVGPAFARIIYDVGITSVKAFVATTAEEFIHIYEDKTQKKADFGVGDINFSIELAKELETV